jgi:hypothetical protein
MNTNYDFPVELRPVYTLDNALAHIEVPHRKAVVRTDTQKTLGVVSNDYKILRHADAINAFRTAVGDQANEKSIHIVKGGAQVYAQYDLRGITGLVKKGDVIGMRLTLKNSYDGTNSLQIMLGALRLVCENGMVISRGFLGLSQKHIGEHAEVKLADITEQIAVCANQFHKTLPVMQLMARTPITLDEMSLFAKESITLPEYLRAAAVGAYKKESDRTVWGYYNALTYAITHGMHRETPATAINYGKVAWAYAQKMLS